MFNIYINREEKIVYNTLKKFEEEMFSVSCFNLEWMTESRRVQYEKLNHCLADYSNVEFLIQSLVDIESDDNFAKVSQIELLKSLFLDNKFIILISGQSLVNRIVCACEVRRMHTELKTRIKQCAWAYIVGCKDFFQEAEY